MAGAIVTRDTHGSCGQVRPCTLANQHSPSMRGSVRAWRDPLLSCCLALSLFLILPSHSSSYNTPPICPSSAAATTTSATLSTFAQAHFDSPFSESHPCDAPCHHTRPFVLAVLHRFSRSSIKETFSRRYFICSRRPLDNSAQFHQRPLNQVSPSLNHSSTCLQTRWSRASTTSSRPPRPLAVAAAVASPPALDDLPPLPHL
jgi:hypothetical protein